MSDVALLKLATGIASGILKFWFRDRPILEATSRSILDIFALKTQNIFAQRSGERQMQRIAERICENLQDLLHNEFPRLAENERLAVIHAASDTLDRVNFGVAELLSVDVDPNKLCDHLCTAHARATRDFSPAERELYACLMQQAAQYILDIARELPGYTPATLEEILRRETSLIEKADQLIDELQMIKKGIPDPGNAASRFEVNYRRAVVRQLDHLELFGVDVSSTSKRYRLSVAYVSLSLEKTGPQELVSDEELEIAEAFTPIEALAQHRRILLRGPAGSGKTTFLQWVAVHCAARTMPTELAGFNDYIPFFIPLRRLAGADPCPRPEQFPSYITPLIAEEMPQGWVHQWLRSGRALVLVDGLDELSEASRQKLLAWLVDFSVTFPDAMLLVTTRPHAVEADALAAHGFSDLRVQEMTRTDIVEFVRQWHEAVAETIRDPATAATLGDLQGRLLSTLQRHRPLTRLATSPLLCALLCALNRERSNNLPADRVELYRICVDMFLRRDVERQISFTDYIELGDRQKLTLLEDLAYWMLRNGKSEVLDEECVQRFANKLAAMGFTSAVDPRQGERVHKLFLERTGILRQPSAGRVDFPHRSFQEYLAAAEALAQHDIGFLVSKAHDEHWREVIILAAGRARQDECEELIEQLLAPDGGRFYGAPRALLAAACAEAAVGLRNKIVQALGAQLLKYIPPRSMRDAEDLARAGDLVLPHLHYEPSHPVQVTAACARTLATIGSPQSIDLLAEYALDKRQGVVRELLGAAPGFSTDEGYEQRVLARSACETLRLKDADDRTLERLAVFPQLAELTIDSSIHWLDAFAKFKHLKFLSIHLLQMKYRGSCNPLSRLTSLKDLRLVAALGHPIERIIGDLHGTAKHEYTLDVRGLARLDNLRIMILSCSRGRMIGLEALPENLQVLSLVSDTNGPEELVLAARRLCFLDSLTLAAAPDLVDGIYRGAELDLRPLVDLPRLQAIRILPTRQVRDVLRTITTFSKLRTIEIVFWTEALDTQEIDWLQELVSNSSWSIEQRVPMLQLRRS